MSNLAAVTTNLIPTANEGFVQTTSGTISASATTVPLNGTAGLTNGSVFVGIIEPGQAKQQTFTGLVDTSGNQITNVFWTRGTDVSHSAGVTVVDYVTGTHYNMLAKAVGTHTNQDGSLKTQSVKDALGITGNTGGGWDVIATTPTVATGYNKGNKEFDLTFANTNLTTALSPGMRLKLDRTGTVPTQCTDLESSSAQYWAKTTPAGITFTDDFTCEAWVKLESYKDQMVVSRLNAAATQGWYMNFNLNGQLQIAGATTAGGSERRYATYQSVPLNQWVHVAASLDMSGATAALYINGTLVPSLLVNGTATALIQAGDLQVGNFTSSTQYFDGEIAQVRVWSTLRTATQIRDNMAISTVGNESGLVVDFKFNGNGNDSTANANNLTPSGSAAATALDNPFKTTEYAETVAVVYSAPNTIVTVRTPGDYSIPNMVLQNPFYSTQKTPFGWPGSVNVVSDILIQVSQTGFTTQADVLGATSTINVPIGKSLRVSFFANGLQSSTSTTVNVTIYQDGVQIFAETGFVGTATGQIPVALSRTIKPTPGSHTYKVQASSNAGTGTLVAAPTLPAQFILEYVE